MAKWIKLSQESQNNWITEIPLLSLAIKRVFLIYNCSGNAVRGKHRHKKSTHILTCIAGSCKILIDDGHKKTIYVLKDNSRILCLAPSDWRKMYDFSEDCILSCLSNELYDPNDYIGSPYRRKRNKYFIRRKYYPNKKLFKSANIYI